MDTFNLLVYGGLACAASLLIYKSSETGKLSDIPTVGSSLPILSYVNAFRLVRHAREAVMEGYTKYKGRSFKVALLDRWLVVVTSPELIEELRKSPDDELSFIDAVEEMVQIKYTFGPEVHDNPMHVEIIRFRLTRNLGVLFPDIRDEIITSFNDYIPLTNDWTPFPVLETMRRIVTRVSSRVFVGIPMCRNEEYIKLSIDHAMDIVKTRTILLLFPDVLKPLVASVINKSATTIARAKILLGPMTAERIQKLNTLGSDWEDRPNDLLQWVIEASSERGHDPLVAIQTLMVSNFAAIHTSSYSFTHALYHLAASPEIIKPIREEVESIIKEDGWTKAAMNKMRKIDSLLKESARVNGISLTSVMRRAMKNVTLSDGTFLPKGTIAVAAAAGIHSDDNNYVHPEVFDPFRFSDIREEVGEGIKHQFVSTSVDYIPFGHGKHACPGRFFAANELKAMMAHIVLNYDVKFENEGVRPPNVGISLTVVPDPTATVLFRKRRD